MSVGFLEPVKNFLVKLSQDKAFRAQLQNGSIAERKQVLQDAGYSFTQEEFETSTLKILELKEEGELSEITEEALAVVGGWGRIPIVPLYGTPLIPWWLLLS